MKNNGKQKTIFLLMWTSGMLVKNKLTKRLKGITQICIEHECTPDNFENGSYKSVYAIYQVDDSIDPKAVPDDADCCVVSVGDCIYDLYYSIKDSNQHSNHFKTVAPALQRMLINDVKLNTIQPYKYILFWSITEEQINDFRDLLNKKASCTVVKKNPSNSESSGYDAVFMINDPISHSFILDGVFNLQISSLPDLYFDKSEIIEEIELYDDRYLNDVMINIRTAEREEKINSVIKD